MTELGGQEEDLAVMAELSAEIQREYAGDAADPWEASPFAWIRRSSSRRKGAIAERLVKAWARRSGIDVERASDSGHDCVLDGVRVEVKMSTLWEGGVLKFQQFRDQSYDVGALLAIEPQAVRLWFVPKETLRMEPGQHTGQAAEETKWLSFPAAAPPRWIDAYGGTLGEARGALEEARRHLGR